MQGLMTQNRALRLGLGGEPLLTVGPGNKSATKEALTPDSIQSDARPHAWATSRTKYDSKMGTVSSSDGEAATVSVSELSLKQYTGDTAGITTHWASTTRRPWNGTTGWPLEPPTKLRSVFSDGKRYDNGR